MQKKPIREQFLTGATLQESRNGWTIFDRAAKQNFFVQKKQGKYVGRCSCAEDQTPGHQCSHQIYVRRHLMDTWWFGKGSKVR